MMGESLGTGVAVALAAERRVGGVLLDSPYASIDRIGARLYPWLPVRLLASDRFDSEARIAQLDEPLLIVHCEGDRLIPIAEARRLLARARRGGELLSVAGCGHVETWRDAAARARMLAVLADITDGVATPR